MIASSLTSLALVGLLAGAQSGPKPPPAASDNDRSAVVCVRAVPGPRPLTFSGQLVGKRPQPGAFKLPTQPRKDVCQTLLRSKVAEWRLEVTTSGFTACALPAPEFGKRVYYSAQASARGLICKPIGTYPIGNWRP